MPRPLGGSSGLEPPIRSALRISMHTGGEVPSVTKSVFRTRLEERQPRASGDRRWVFVPYDQLTDAVGPLAETDAERLGIVVVECPAKGARRPYHRQKLALVIANLRQFALEQAERGVAVRHIVAERDYGAALAPLADELGPLVCMEPAERELRQDLQPLVARGALRMVPHAGWMSTPTDFQTAHPRGAPFRMDRFYRQVRRSTGVLMDGAGEPVGGKFSFDPENREAWYGAPPAPTPPRFTPDAVTEEVLELIAIRYADHPGRLDAESLPATAADAETLWIWAQRECLPAFGPFQDAMSTRSSSLFHARIAPLLHLHRLLPQRVVADALALDLPIASCEGFVRQVLGWREFVRHVHRETDGFRTIAADAAPRFFASATEPLPPAFWGEPSGLHCLDTVVGDVWREGYGHHITRLMVLANIATLLDVSPRELTDWFWVAYTDAFDWVVEPNVLGMGTFAVGDLMTTKPYVAGSNYIDKMSDYCDGCAFDPKKTCP
ncbi:MAG: cryptochrome/photolyase family protein, partial [Planctomycetes bacterium]|nr:cryptochrome/photolyase family protein [Planctomycetota bacterium]